MSPVVTSSFPAGYGQSFVLPIKDVSGRLMIELKGGYISGDTYYSYALGEVDLNGHYVGVGAYAVNTRWIKN